MRRRPALLLLCLASIWGLVLPGGAAASPASPSRIVDLRIQDGGDWRADNLFCLQWTLHTPAGAPAVTAVHYQVHSPDHPDAITPRRLPWASTYSEPISLPVSGEYLAEVWAEDTLGQLTPRATVTLQLDQGRPAAVAPLLPGGWIGGGPVHMRVTEPEPPLPLSGIRGYAVSVDRDPDGHPCAARARCGESEVDLRAGIAGNWLLLPSLPEGLVHVHAVAVSGSGMSSQRVGTAVVRVDASVPRVTLQGSPAGWAQGPVRLSATASDALSGMAPSGRDGPFTAIAVDGGTPTTVPGSAATALVSGDGIHRVEYYGRDAAGNVNAGGAGDPPATATVRIDGGAPRVVFADRRDPGDPERLEALVADPLSGPSATRGTIGVRPARSRQPFRSLPTAVAEGRLAARWDSDSYPDGSYEFEAIGYDQAGNAGASVQRANGSRMVLANPLKTRTALEARLGGRGQRPRSVASGRSIRLTGRLLGPARVPLAGQEIRVVESFDPGAVPESLLTIVRTGADGGFALPVPPGPGRKIEVAFAGTKTLARAAAPPLRCEVRGGVRMRASATTARIGGRPVVFRGRVARTGAAMPADGLPVTLQFRLPGLPWREFRTVTANRRGAFRYRYSFADDDSRGVRFQFRAVVAARKGWPYATGASRPIAVTGR
jgi:hypothetical protein